MTDLRARVLAHLQTRCRRQEQVASELGAPLPLVRGVLAGLHRDGLVNRHRPDAAAPWRWCAVQADVARARDL